MGITFKSIGLEDQLIKGLAKEKIVEPTQIQQKAIQPISEGKDVIGQASTGSGKTLAYLLPLFQKIDADSKALQVIILAPTQELIVQINNEIKLLGKNANMPVNSTTIIGNVNIKRQIEKLKTKPQIIVGSPGRMLELIKLKKIKCHQVKTIVIDEGDRMLGRDHVKGVEDVIKTTLRDRQLLVFSATISEESLAKAKSLMKEPVELMVKESSVNPNIQHFYVKTTFRDKFKELRSVLNKEKPYRAIVFLNRNERIQEVAERLVYHGYKATAIFGNATKQERKNAMDQLKNGKANILVASDLVARGLDIKKVTHIINLDIPQNLNEYLHRVGRTARGKEKGKAISLITDKEMSIVEKIQRKFKVDIKDWKQRKEMHDNKDQKIEKKKVKKPYRGKKKKPQ